MALPSLSFAQLSEVDEQGSSLENSQVLTLIPEVDDSVSETCSALRTNSAPIEELDISASEELPDLTPAAVSTLESVLLNSLTPSDFPGAATNGPVYFLWNNGLDMLNVAEMLNGGGSFYDSIVSVFSNSGVFNNQVGSWLFRDGTSHLVIPDSSAPYGIGRMDIIPADTLETFDGLIAQYRFAPNNQAGSQEIEFAKFSPFIESVSGTKYMTYVTYQPSLNPADVANQVTVWAEVANPDASSAKSFTANIYDTSGSLASSETFLVPAMGRFDVQAGHVTPGASNQGLVEIVPLDSNTPFVAQLSRYGGNSPAGINPSSFSFATSSVGNNGYTSEIVAPVSSGGGAQNWVVVTNTASVGTSVLVEFLDYNANIVQSDTVNLTAKSQATFAAHVLFPGGSSGLVRITPQGSEAIIADSTFYFYKPNGSVSAAYVTHAEPNYSGTRYGAYNAFLGQQNWLKLYNDSSSVQTVTIRLNRLGITFPALAIGSSTLTLQPNTGLDVELRETLGFAILPDSYGTVVIDSSSDGVFAQILRLRLLNGYIDLAEGTTVR